MSSEAGEGPRKPKPARHSRGAKHSLPGSSRTAAGAPCLPAPTCPDGLVKVPGPSPAMRLEGRVFPLFFDDCQKWLRRVWAMMRAHAPEESVSFEARIPWGSARPRRRRSRGRLRRSPGNRSARAGAGCRDGPRPRSANCHGPAPGTSPGRNRALPVTTACRCGSVSLTTSTGSSIPRPALPTAAVRASPVYRRRPVRGVTHGDP